MGSTLRVKNLNLPVLRMRSCDLLESYTRAKTFMRKVRATGNKHFVPTCFQENCEALESGTLNLFQGV